jgi:hypothetical protein
VPLGRQQCNSRSFRRAAILPRVMGNGAPIVQVLAPFADLRRIRLTLFVGIKRSAV